jgi:hypothetical protein
VFFAEPAGGGLHWLEKVPAENVVVETQPRVLTQRLFFGAFFGGGGIPR